MKKWLEKWILFTFACGGLNNEEGIQIKMIALQWEYKIFYFVGSIIKYLVNTDMNIFFTFSDKFWKFSLKINYCWRVGSDTKGVWSGRVGSINKYFQRVGSGPKNPDPPAPLFTTCKHSEKYCYAFMRFLYSQESLFYRIMQYRWSYG